MKPNHERMPVNIAPEDWMQWLSAPIEKTAKLVCPYPAETMQARPVSFRAAKWTMMKLGGCMPNSLVKMASLDLATQIFAGSDAIWRTTH
jgi:hypothetical protein